MFAPSRNTPIPRLSFPLFPSRTQRKGENELSSAATSRRRSIRLPGARFIPAAQLQRRAVGAMSPRFDDSLMAASQAFAQRLYEEAARQQDGPSAASSAASDDEIVDAEVVDAEVVDEPGTAGA